MHRESRDGEALRTLRSRRGPLRRGGGEGPAGWGESRRRTPLLMLPHRLLLLFLLLVAGLLLAPSLCAAAPSNLAHKKIELAMKVRPPPMGMGGEGGVELDSLLWRAEFITCSRSKVAATGDHLRH